MVLAWVRGIFQLDRIKCFFQITWVDSGYIVTYKYQENGCNLKLHCWIIIKLKTINFLKHQLKLEICILTIASISKVKKMPVRILLFSGVVELFWGCCVCWNIYPNYFPFYMTRNDFCCFKQKYCTLAKKNLTPLKSDFWRLFLSQQQCYITIFVPIHLTLCKKIF